MKKRKKSDIDEFIALPDSEKERIIRQIESETLQESLTRSRPLNARERRQWERFKARSKAATRRRDEVRSGRVQPVRGKQVQAEVRQAIGR